MANQPFDNVKNQVGYCGIWCGSCVVGNGTLKEISAQYEKIAQNYGLEEWAAKNFDFDEFKKGLESIQATSSCPGCLKGGGRDNCEMRRCASTRNISDCCECDAFMKCKNSDVLKSMREGARNANLLVKDEGMGQKDFIMRGMIELKRRFPSCNQLCDHL